MLIIFGRGMADLEVQLNSAKIVVFPQSFDFLPYEQFLLASVSFFLLLVYLLVLMFLCASLYRQ